MKKKIVLWLSIIVMAIFPLSGCNFNNPVDEDFVDNGEFYTLKMYLPIQSPTPSVDTDKVVNEINKILKEKINAEVDLTCINFPSYYSKIQNEISSNSTMDLIYTSAENYRSLLAQEALFPMDKLLESKSGKNVWNDVKGITDNGEKLWDQVRSPLDNKIYSVPNIQIIPRTAGITMLDYKNYEEWMTEKGYNEDMIADSTLEQRFNYLEKYCDWLKDNNKGKGGITYGVEMPYFVETFLTFDDLGLGMSCPGVYDFEQPNGEPTIINQFKSSKFKWLIEKLVSWYGKYIPSKSGVVYDDTNTDFIHSRTWKPSEISTSRVSSTKVRTRKNYRFGKSYYYQSYVQGTMWSIPATSENPARAMKMIDLMHTDEEVHNLLKWGIKGEHYTLDEQKRAKPGKNASNYNNERIRWILGNETIGYPTNKQDANVFEQIKEVNKNTKMSPIVGFVFNSESVKNEVVACNEISMEFWNMIKPGNYTENNFKTLLDRLDNAGAQKIIDEKNKQLKAWLNK